MFAVTIGFGIVIPVVPTLIMELTGEPIGRAAEYSGWLMLLFASVNFLAMPILGNLSDRYGRRPVLVFSLAGTVVSFVMLALAHAVAVPEVDVTYVFYAGEEIAADLLAVSGGWSPLVHLHSQRHAFLDPLPVLRALAPAGIHDERARDATSGLPALGVVRRRHGHAGARRKDPSFTPERLSATAAAKAGAPAHRKIER